MNIGDNIKVIRERKRMTAKALASELDLDISTLNRVENGIIKQFKPEFIIKICQIFGCTLDELFYQIRKINFNKGATLQRTYCYQRQTD